MACSKGFSERLLKEDRISQLPDPLISEILCHLSPKETVKTSVLSTRWKSLWLSVPRLDLAWLHLSNFTAFKSFGDKFFDPNSASCIDQVKLFIGGDIGLKKGVDDIPSYLTPWFEAAIKRKIQHLDAWFDPCPSPTYEMPLRLYTCETLVSLKLSHVTLDYAEVVSLPCLKTMHLKYICYRKEANFERLVSRCPVLEELKISVFGHVNDDAKVFRVLSRSLKKLRIKKHIVGHGSGSGFVIDAPRLLFLSISDKLSESYIIKDVDSIAKVDISLSFGLNVFDGASISSGRSRIHSFLHGIAKVRDMTICRDTFKLICQYSKIEPLPQFGSMSRLHVTFRVSDMSWLPTFLESFPNLKSLILVWNTNSKKINSEELREFNYSVVPECLLSSLEFVDIKSNFSGHFAELKLLMYLLGNSAILKKLTLRLNHYRRNEKYIVNTLLQLPRRSITCKVVVY